MIKFKVKTNHETRTIDKIVHRAVMMSDEVGIKYSAMGVQMDVTACHLNGCRLNLDALLTADEFNFGHDVFGIRRHLNRITGKLDNRFLPRFAQLIKKGGG